MYITKSTQKYIVFSEDSLVDVLKKLMKTSLELHLLFQSMQS